MSFLSIEYHGEGRFEQARREVPAPSEGEVQIEVAYTGICGTDLKIAHGAMDGRFGSPWPIGHETSGTIAAVGSGVEGWSVGDKVTVMPLDWCGDCPACNAGHTHICHNLNFMGIDSPGSLQERWNVAARTLVRIPDAVDLRSAALVEPVAVAVHDVRRAETSAGDRVVVIGGGPIGLLIAIVATAAGAEVLISEVSAFRIDLAQRLGLRTINPLEDDLGEAVSKWTDGKGADAAFEVSGSAAGVQSMTDVLAVRGTGVVVAIHPDPQPVNLFSMFWKELRVLGARVYQRQDFETALSLLEDGTIPADALITDVMPLDQTQEAIERLSSGDAIVKLLVGGE